MPEPHIIKFNEHKEDPQLLFQVLELISYGHSQFSDHIDMPNLEKYLQHQENTHKVSDEIHTTLDEDLETKLKAHPILSKTVQFSGISDPAAYQLPHTSKEAIARYLHELKLRLSHKNQYRHTVTLTPR